VQGAASNGPHIRTAASTGSLQLEVMLASVPAVLLGVGNLGAQMLQHAPAEAASSAVGWLSSLSLGASIYGPALAVSVAASGFWALAFARLRQRPVDPGWLLTGWLYVALLPGALPLWAALTGISFGMVFGSQIFGGTGRYPVSPALLGVLFLTIAYPDYFAASGWLPGLDAAPAWSLVAAGGSEALTSAGWSWLDLAIGRELGAVGAVSDLACLAGAAFLIFRGWASWRTLLAAVAGVWIASLILTDGEQPTALAWHWHLVVGNFAFVLAFIATDPTTQAMTPIGRVLHGALAGSLLVLFRVANPAHPESTLHAFLLASLVTPLLDQVVLLFRGRGLRRMVDS
jgi:Na+-transporting NADH:ubiquinone oxidoreductase subunit B